jgi:meiotic recombination protein DMC1
MEERADEEQQVVQQIQVAEGEYYMDVDRLQEMGINATDIKKLKQAGLNTIASLVMQTRKVGGGAAPF